MLHSKKTGSKVGISTSPHQTLMEHVETVCSVTIGEDSFIKSGDDKGQAHTSKVATKEQTDEPRMEGAMGTDLMQFLKQLPTKADFDDLADCMENMFREDILLLHQTTTNLFTGLNALTKEIANISARVSQIEA